MRVLRIGEADGGPGAIELHPQVTVIEGLRGAARSRILDGLAEIGHGHVDGVIGEIEAQGVRFDLTTESLALLELPRGISLVVDADDIPGTNGGASRLAVRRQRLEEERDTHAKRLDDAQKAAEAAESERADATTALAEARAGYDESRSAKAEEQRRRAEALAAADQRLEAAEVALAAADQVLSEAQGAHDAAEADVRSDAERAGSEGDAAAELRDQHAELRAATSRSADAVDEVQAALDPSSAESVEPARAAVVEAEAALAALLDSDGDAESESGRGREDEPEAAEPVDEERIAKLLDRRRVVAHDLHSLSDADATAVADAIERATSESGDDEALAKSLADQWDEITAHLFDLGVGADPPTPTDPESDAVVSARTRVDEARQQLTDVLAAVSSEPLGADDITELEAAHVEVLDAQERSEARFGGSKARRRLTEAREAEQSILDRLGFATYAEFMMSSSRSISASDQGKVNEGRKEVEDAEQALADVTDEPPSGDGDWLDEPGRGEDGSEWDDLERSSVSQRRDQLVVDIADLLGHEIVGDPTDELRRWGTESELAKPDVALRQALTQVGMALEDADFQTDTLIALARVWLAEQRSADTRRTDLEAQLVDIDAELNGLGVEVESESESDGAEGDEPPSAQDAEESEPAEDPELTEARARVDASTTALASAEARVDAHETAVAQLAQREADFAAAQAAEDDMAARISDLEAEPGARAAALSERQQSTSAAVRVAEGSRLAAMVEAEEARSARSEFEPDDADAEAADDDPVPGLEARLAAATVAVGSTSAESRTLEVQLAGLDRQLADLKAEEQAIADQDPDSAMSEELLEEIEWFLLSTLAERRQVSLAGSLPLVLDDPFRGLSPAESTRLVSGLERMAGAVQIILITDEPSLIDWADGLEPSRAGVVHL